ncbi:dihydropteroate synthase [Candidatus Methylospira mobilis]|nr:dihydropteroate synthase [Candidatus Methylospira mobilis]
MMNRIGKLHQNKLPLIMGILNATPDSFSDGGRYLDSGKAIEHAIRMAAEGADIIDIGGESTRPGALPVNAGEQLARSLPIITALRAALPDILISIDTTLADVAEAALVAGVDIINDISAGINDPAMFNIAARHRCPIVLMHMQGQPETMQDNPHYRHVVQEVCDYLTARAKCALQAGIARENILFDPGIGFGKRRQDNLDLLAHLDTLVALGYPVLLGTSRKRFMGALCDETEAQNLLGATVATTALGVDAGVKILRVHDVRENKQAAIVAYAIGVRKHETP